MMYYFGDRMMGGRGLGMGLGIIVCLIVIALVVLAIIALVRYIRSTNRAHYTATHIGAPSAGSPVAGATHIGAPSTGAPVAGATRVGAPSAGAPAAGAPQYSAPVVDTALQILNERYARGEISDDEYRAKKAEILR